MKKFFVIMLLSLGVMGHTKLQANNASWVIWLNSPNHNGTPGEFAEMLNYINISNPQKAISLELSTGTRVRITYPRLWFNNFLMCYQRSDPSVTASSLAISVMNDPQVYWDENISVLTKNFYCVNANVLYVDNYSGIKTRRLTGMHNGSPVYLASCGNPQEVIAPPAPALPPPTATFYYPNGGQEKIYVVKTSSADVNITNSGNTTVTYEQPRTTFWDRVSLGVGVNFNTGGYYHPYYQQYYPQYQQYYNPQQWPTRTMPNAIGASGQTYVDNGGGVFIDGTVPGYSRTMPSGL